MAIPNDKDPQVVKHLEEITQTVFGRSRSKSIRADICVSCGGSATEFTNELSVKEYTISGFCQKCQDKRVIKPHVD